MTVSCSTEHVESVCDGVGRMEKSDEDCSARSARYYLGDFRHKTIDVTVGSKILP